MLTLVSGFIVTIAALGWTVLLDYGASAFPAIQEFTTSRFIRSIGILAGLALLLSPFYTLLYFHHTTKTEVLVFKTLSANQKPKLSRPANLNPPITSAAEQPRVPGSEGS